MLIVNGTVLTFGEQPKVIPWGALRLEGDRIAEVGLTSELTARCPAEETLDASGQLVMPGLICSHTHFYGAFARGMALPGPAPHDFRQTLERLWWRLDRGLTLPDVAASAEACLADAIRHGVTTLFDHHASPNAIAGSLDALAEAVERAGLRACLCYEVSDRDGPERMHQGLLENVRWARAARGSTRLAAMMGLHASLTLSDETLRLASSMAEKAGLPCHIHVAEDRADVDDALRRYGLPVVERLRRFGILGEGSIAAHCVHVDGFERDALWEMQTHVAHNPRSNMNNGVGTAAVPSMLRRGLWVGLGNDGFSNNLFQEMQAACLVHKLASGDPQAMPADAVLDLVFTGGTRLARRTFGLPLGQLAPGAAADVITVRHQPITPLHAKNYPWHIIFGVDGCGVENTIVAGRFLMREGQILTLDEEAVAARARQQAGALWQRLTQAQNH
ncbi:MAG: putative aminohydrolase SsnA [Chloroflexi bacterium]|nr:putative aminohydrolase SsnA [Chloroflexota bacterium]